MQSKDDPRFHHRHSIRLQGHDYSQAGMYFVTLVTRGQAALFGEVVEGEMRLNQCGKIVQKWWDNMEEHFPNVETGAFVVMPNHVHGIITIGDDRRGTVPVPRGDRTPPREEAAAQPGGETPPRQKPTLGQIVAYFKYQSTKEINVMNGGMVSRLRQRNFYDHILRNQQDLELTWLYIESNPAHWVTDRANPGN